MGLQPHTILGGGLGMDYVISNYARYYTLDWEENLWIIIVHYSVSTEKPLYLSVCAANSQFPIFNSQ